MYTVYKHTSPSGKVYIGLTAQQVEKRWRGGKGYKYNQAFYKAIQKYGWDNIKHEIIAENLTAEQAQKLEIELIEKYDSRNKNRGYNICVGGDLSWLGVKHTEETKKKMSELKKGKPSSRKGAHLSEETKIKLSLSHKGKYRGKPVLQKQPKSQKIIFTQSHKDKIRKALKGRERSAEVRKHMSEAQIKTKKAVICLETNVIYESMTAAAKFVGVTKTQIGRVCSGKIKSTKGYTFRLLSEVKNV